MEFCPCELCIFCHPSKRSPGKQWLCWRTLAPKQQLWTSLTQYRDCWRISKSKVNKRFFKMMYFQCVYFPKFIPRLKIPNTSLIFTFPWTKESLVILLLKLSGNDPSFLKVLPQALNRCCLVLCGCIYWAPGDAPRWVFSRLWDLGAHLPLFWNNLWYCLSLSVPTWPLKGCRWFMCNPGHVGMSVGMFFWSPWNGKLDCNPF